MELQLLSKYRSHLMGVALIWIIIYHYFGGAGANARNLYEAILALGHGGVDIFFFLSGLGLFYSYSQLEKSLSFYIKRIIRIIPTYYICIIIYSICNHITFQDQLWMLSCIGFFVGKPMYDWYIPSLLFLYFLFPIFYYFFKRSPLRSIFYTIIISFVFTFIIIYIQKGTIILLLSRIPVFFIGAYFGYMIKQNKNIKIRNIKILITLSIILFITIAILLIEYGPLFMRKSSLAHLPFMIIAPSTCILFSSFFEKLCSKNIFIYMIILKVLEFIGIYSLEIYLIHMWLRQYGLWYIFIPINLLFAIILANITKPIQAFFIRKINNL